MAQESGFFNARMEGNEYDRVYNAEQFADYFASFIGNGVFGNIMSELVVKQNDTPNMSVNVASGKAWVNGWWYKNTDDYNLSIDVADGVLNRIDVVVVRWGNVERDMYLQVIKGTPSANPVAPDIERDVDYYDLKLCEISVPAGAINIRQAQITDTRAISEVCGFVTGLIDQIDATDLFLQFKAQFGDFMDVNYEEFNEWFNYMKDQLSEDAAGRLQQEIDVLRGDVTDINGNIIAEYAGENIPFKFGIDTETGDYGYYKAGADTVTPFKSKHTEIVTPNSRALYDMGEYHKKRYIDLSGVPNTNSQTYTYPANNTGGTVDLGESNNYRYVNAANVYAKGKADGGLTLSSHSGFYGEWQGQHNWNFSGAKYTVVCAHSSNWSGANLSLATNMTLIENRPFGNQGLRMYVGGPGAYFNFNPGYGGGACYIMYV